MTVQVEDDLESLLTGELHCQAFPWLHSCTETAVWICYFGAACAMPGHSERSLLWCEERYQQWLRVSGRGSSCRCGLPLAHDQVVPL